MVGATVMRLSSMDNSDAMDSNNSSMSSNSSLDDYRVMVAATVTVLSGIVQVSTYSYKLPSQSACPDLYMFFLIFLLLATPPHFSIWLAALLPQPIGNNFKGATHHWVERQIHIAKMSEHGSRKKEKWVQEGVRSEKLNSIKYSH